MGKIKFELLDNDKETKSFYCHNGSIERIIAESYFLTLLKHAYAYRFSTEGEILGYYMILFRKIELSLCPEIISEYYCDHMNYCVAVHIDYLAVSSKYQHKGIGTTVLKIVIKSIFDLSESFPVRIITIDALKEVYDWYCEIGFTAFDKDDLKNSNPTISMYMDCINAKDMEKIEEYKSIC